MAPSVDVVFIMEAGACNNNAAKKTFFNSLVSSMVTEFKYLSLESRFAVLLFGGTQEFEKPRSFTTDGHVFTDDKKINVYFEHLRDGNSTGDVFTALTIASKLVFKPGAAKLFILSLCTKCEFNSLKVFCKNVFVTQF